MVHVEQREAAPAETKPPLMSLRLASMLFFLVGLLILAHGCHGPDEDHELFAPGRVGHLSSVPPSTGEKA